MTGLSLTNTSTYQAQQQQSGVKKQSASKRREIFHHGKTPSLLGRPVGEDLDNAIAYHATSRISLMYLLCVAYENHSGSDNTASSNFHVKGAIAQGGKGRNKYHAAHSFVAGGFQDEIIKNKIEQIASKQNITPNTKTILKKKGINTGCQKQLLKKMSDTPNMETIFEEFGLDTCLINNTRIQRLLQTTVNLPYRINLHHDKKLEKLLRGDILPDLITKCYDGKISAEKATQTFIKIVREHFEEQISSLESSSNPNKEDLRYYKELLKSTPQEGCDLSSSFGVNSTPKKRELQQNLLSMTSPSPLPKKRRLSAAMQNSNTNL